MILTLKVKSKKTTQRNKNKSKFENNDLRYLYLAANAAFEKKGEDILLLDVSRLTTIADYFLIVSAKSQAQIEAIAKNIEERFSKTDYYLLSKEGFSTSNWIILDFGNIVVNIMNWQVRDYYKLERFWSNATIINSNLWKKAS